MSIALHSDAALLIRVISKAIHVAQSNLGYGEEGANNAGRFLELIGGRPGEEWCALWASYPYRRAHELLGLEPPAWCYRRPGFIEVGARALVKAMGRAGRRFRDPREARAGDLVLYRRPSLLSWQAHVEFVEDQEDGFVTTIAGNVGRFPAKTKRLIHDVMREPHCEGFASLRR